MPRPERYLGSYGRNLDEEFHRAHETPSSDTITATVRVYHSGYSKATVIHREEYRCERLNRTILIKSEL